MRKTREQIEYQLSIKRNRLDLYLKREAEMLDGGVQSYGIGSRNLARYNPDMDAIERRLQGLEEKPKAPQQRRQRQRHNRADAFDDW